MDDAFVRASSPLATPDGLRIILPFVDDKLIVLKHGDTIRLLNSADFAAMVGAATDWDSLYLGTLAGMPVQAGELGVGTAIPESMQTHALRDLYGRVSDEEYGLAGYASQMLHWRRTSQYCPACGEKTAARDGDWGRFCPKCGHVGYALVTPATLILIHDGSERILLGHKPGWGDRYSILAGFVEPGESLEACVRREAMEEAGVELDRLTYAGSQSWPFPHQLMIGFNARCTSDNIRIDGVELDDARWFTRTNLPQLPLSVSLSRQMIDAWLAEF